MCSDLSISIKINFLFFQARLESVKVHLEIEPESLKQVSTFDQSKCCTMSFTNACMFI